MVWRRFEFGAKDFVIVNKGDSKLLIFRICLFGGRKGSACVRIIFLVRVLTESICYCFCGDGRLSYLGLLISSVVVVVVIPVVTFVVLVVASLLARCLSMS